MLRLLKKTFVNFCKSKSCLVFKIVLFIMWEVGRALFVGHLVGIFYLWPRSFLDHSFFWLGIWFIGLSFELLVWIFRISLVSFRFYFTVSFGCLLISFLICEWIFKVNLGMHVSIFVPGQFVKTICILLSLPCFDELRFSGLDGCSGCVAAWVHCL